MLIAECCVRRLAPHCAFQSINASSAELKTDVETLLRVSNNGVSFSTDPALYLNYS